MDGKDWQLATAAVLTPEAREQWLARAFEMFPRLRGADVADVLDELRNADAFLRFTEPWFDGPGAALHAELDAAVAVMGASIRMAVVAGGASLSFDFEALAEKIARAAVAGETGTVQLVG